MAGLSVNLRPWVTEDEKTLGIPGFRISRVSEILLELDLSKLTVELRFLIHRSV